MMFADPHWLVLIPFFLLFSWKKMNRGVRFSHMGLMAHHRSLRLRFAFVSPLLLSLSGVVLSIALSRPQTQWKENVLEREGIDIMLVMYTSGSMQADDFRWQGVNVTRMEISKQVMGDFIQQRANDRMGTVLFGEQAYTYVPLTLDHYGMIGFLNGIEVGLAGGGATAIGDGIAIAAKRLLEREEATKIMILVTDGQSNTGIRPLDAGRAAAEFGIRVYTIGIGGASSDVRGFFSKKSGIDEQTLEAIATISGGKFYRAQDTTSLQQIYEEIDRLEPSTATYTEYSHQTEEALPWIVLTVLGLFGYLVLSETWLRRIP